MAAKERELIFSPDARRQLSQLRAFDQRRITDAIRQQLLEADPKEETRNKFALDVTAAIHARPQENQGLRAHESGRHEVRELRPAGFEPATLGLGNRCSIP